MSQAHEALHVTDGTSHARRYYMKALDTGDRRAALPTVKAIPDAISHLDPRMT